MASSKRGPHEVENGAVAVFEEEWPVAETFVGNPGGGAEGGTVTCCVKPPFPSAVAVPTLVTCTRISTSSPAQNPLPETVIEAPRGAVARDSVISGVDVSERQSVEAPPGPPPVLPATVNGAVAVFDDEWPVAETDVGNPGGGADSGTVTFCVKRPFESAVTVPTVVMWTRSSTSSADENPLPETVRVAPRGAEPSESVISALSPDPPPPPLPPP